MDNLARETRSSLETERKKWNCNFVAPDLEHWELWGSFRKQTKDQGMDICRVLFGYIAAHMKGTAEVKTPGQTTVINQINNNYYQVEKSRREPLRLNCARAFNSRTISSMALEALVMVHARELPRSFSYRDFSYLSHDSFRKIVLRLKKKGKIIPLPQRTNPRFYALAERMNDYPALPDHIGEH